MYELHFLRGCGWGGSCGRGGWGRSCGWTGWGRDWRRWPQAGALGSLVLQQRGLARREYGRVSSTGSHFTADVIFFLSMAIICCCWKLLVLPHFLPLLLASSTWNLELMTFWVGEKFSPGPPRVLKKEGGFFFVQLPLIMICCCSLCTKTTRAAAVVFCSFCCCCMLFDSFLASSASLMQFTGDSGSSRRFDLKAPFKSAASWRCTCWAPMPARTPSVFGGQQLSQFLSWPPRLGAASSTHCSFVDDSTSRHFNSDLEAATSKIAAALSSRRTPLISRDSGTIFNGVCVFSRSRLAAASAPCSFIEDSSRRRFRMIALKSTFEPAASRAGGCCSSASPAPWERRRALSISWEDSRSIFSFQLTTNSFSCLARSRVPSSRRKFQPLIAISELDFLFPVPSRTATEKREKAMRVKTSSSPTSSPWSSAKAFHPLENRTVGRPLLLPQLTHRFTGHTCPLGPRSNTNFWNLLPWLLKKKAGRCCKHNTAQKNRQLWKLHSSCLLLLVRTSFHEAALNVDFAIKAAFRYVFSSTCAHSHLTALPVKHWPMHGAVRAVSQTVTHHTMTSVPCENVCSRVLNMINSIFSQQLPLSNGKWLFLQHKIMPMSVAFSIRMLWSEHTVCNCDHNSLMEGDPQSHEIAIT